MNAIIEQTNKVMYGLDERSQFSVLKYAEFLAFEEDEEDVRLYDEAKANDDGYRISLEDLRKKWDAESDDEYDEEDEEDVRLYDEAKANDDGYRISHEDLMREYGL